MILVSGTGCGFALSSRLTRRKRNLEMILRMLILLKGEIRYGNTSLYDAFTGAAGKLEGKYRDFFLLTAREMQRQKGESFGEIFRKCAEECLVAEELTGEEREKLYSLGRCLGYLGLEMQMKQLELMEEDIRSGTAEEIAGKKKDVSESWDSSWNFAGGDRLVKLVC